MEKQERKYKRIEDLDESGVATLLKRWQLDEFVEFTIEKQIDGRRLLNVSEGIVKLWKPKSNPKKFITFIEDIKHNPYKYLDINDNAENSKQTNTEDNTTNSNVEAATEKEEDTVDIESQYQTIPIRKKEDQTSTMSTVEEIIRRIVPAKSFLYRHRQNTERTPSYLPMDAGTPKKRKLFTLSSYEYPFFDLKARFSRQESANDRGYYAMKCNSKYCTTKVNKKPENKNKYKSLPTPDELNEQYPEDHFYEDLCYNEVEKIKEKPIENRVVTVKPCIVKIQELFQSFKVPFFRRQEMLGDKRVEVNENEKEANFYENSDSIVNMYDSVRVNRPVSEDKLINQTKSSVEDYLEPVQLSKDYCDITYKQKDDSLLGYIMSIFENRFGIRRVLVTMCWWLKVSVPLMYNLGSRLGDTLADFFYHTVHCLTDVVAETNDDHHSTDSESELKGETSPAIESRKWPEDRKHGRTNMADRPLPVPVENEPYYMNIDRNEAQNLLKGQPDGTFVLRPSSQHDHAYTISVACANAVHNVGVRRRPDGRLALGFARRGEQSFGTVTSLLRHHKKKRLLLVAGGDVIGATTLNESPHYYQSPSSIPVPITKP